MCLSYLKLKVRESINHIQLPTFKKNGFVIQMATNMNSEWRLIRRGKNVYLCNI